MADDDVPDGSDDSGPSDAAGAPDEPESGAGDSKDSAAEAVKRLRKILNALIHSSGRSRRDIDRALGVTRGYTSRVLAGETQITYERTLQIAEVLGFPYANMSFLLHGPPRLPLGLWRRWVDATEPRGRRLGNVPTSEQQMPPPPPYTNKEWEMVLLSIGLGVMAAEGIVEEEEPDEGSPPNPPES
jgi:transcriptional regulator with XRE-family HTH domain